MNQRERSMLLVLIAVGGAVLLFGGYLAVNKVLAGFNQKRQQIAKLRLDIRANDAKLQKLRKDQVKLEGWRAISLPQGSEVLGNSYRAFLRELCEQHELDLRNLTGGGSSPRASSSRTANPITPLSYQLQVEGNLQRLVRFLEDFYSLNLPHIVRELTITAARDNNPRLEANFKIEVLSLPNATNRDFLLAVPDPRLLWVEVATALKHGPTGLALGPWLVSPVGLYGKQKLAAHLNPDRDYTRLVGKNAFVGLVAPASQLGPLADRKVLEFVQLTLIDSNFIGTKAWLRCRMTGRFYQLREDGGLDSFEIVDQNGQSLLKGKVKAIHDRDIVYTVDDKYYVLNIGQFLSEAREAKEEELKTMGVNLATAAEKP
jgi:hypothetical protein